MRLPLLTIRLILAAIGVLVWGYAQRTNDHALGIVGMVILGIAIVLKFLPKRWFAGDTPDAA